MTNPQFCIITILYIYIIYFLYAILICTSAKKVVPLHAERKYIMTKKEEIVQDPIRIVFETENRQAIAYDGDKSIGECEYTVDRTGKWVIVHTGVRPEYNGRGIAKRLLEKVIEAARERGVKIIPVCSYAQRMMSGKDEYKDVL